MSNETMSKAYRMINDVTKSLIYDNRISVLEDFKIILDRVIEECTNYLVKDIKLYRARIYTEEDRYELIKNIKKRYKAYDKKNSYIRLDCIARENRMNPTGIRCLYAASDIETSILEVEPNIEDVISVAKIKIIDHMKIVDFSKISSMIDDDFDRYISLYIQNKISTENYDIKYVFSQFIGQYCKEKGFDAVAYKSRYKTIAEANKGIGVNYAIFSYKKCTPISSYPYEVSEHKLTLYDRLKNVKLSTF